MDIERENFRERRQLDESKPTIKILPNVPFKNQQLSDSIADKYNCHKFASAKRSTAISCDSKRGIKTHERPNSAGKPSSEVGKYCFRRTVDKTSDTECENIPELRLKITQVLAKKSLLMTRKADLLMMKASLDKLSEVNKGASSTLCSTLQKYKVEIGQTMEAIQDYIGEVRKAKIGNLGMEENIANLKKNIQSTESSIQFNQDSLRRIQEQKPDIQRRIALQKERLERKATENLELERKLEQLKQTLKEVQTTNQESKENILENCGHVQVQPHQTVKRKMEDERLFKELSTELTMKHISENQSKSDLSKKSVK